MKWARIGSMALLAFGLTACDSLSELTELEVVNENNPERARALQEAGDVEWLGQRPDMDTFERRDAGTIR